MKLHLGCGTVYLDGWTNIDIPGSHTFLAVDRPDLVEKWKTTDDKYYARHPHITIDSLRKGPIEQEYVCDAFGSFDSIPVAYWEVSELLARHSFEHLSITEAHKALDQIESVMQPNGVLRLDVPDHEETLRLLIDTKDKFYIRHLLGPRRDDRGYHMMSYTRERLRALVEEHGFVYDCEEKNPHVYPAFTLRFIKPGVRAPRDYVELPPLDSAWRVVDIGPGAFPLARANVYVDHDRENLLPLNEPGKRCIVSDLMGGLSNIESGAFDYAWCSHVLEHMDDPLIAAKALSRIAKRGTVVLPSAMKEGLFGHEETDHKWLVLPSSRPNGPPLFVRPDSAYIDKLRDVEMQKIMCRLFRTGPNRNGAEQRYLRQWYYKNERLLDVVVHWTDRLDVRVFE
jgi:predicted SAM-dependent methyltransferase